jgi:guanylate kinase
MDKRIILVGKAGSGKDYFKDFLRDQGHTCDVSYTTRPKRDGEVEGKTYHYITEETFNSLNDSGMFYEAVVFNGWQYATSVSDWKERKVCIKTPSGVAQLTDNDIKESIIIYFDIPLDIRKQRLSKRSDADKVERRLESDEKDFRDFKEFHIRITDPYYSPVVLKTMIFDYQQI